MRTVYFALVHFHYSYRLLTWGNASKSALQRSIILQKRAVRVINNTTGEEVSIDKQVACEECPRWLKDDRGGVRGNIV